MSILNDKTFSEIYDAIEQDLFPKYSRALVEDTDKLHRELINMGLTPDAAFESSVKGIAHIAFTRAVKLNLMITCLGNSTDNYKDVIEFIKTRFSFDDEQSDIRTALKLIKGGKEN